jgi:predicted ATP-grasp superfamily ATP-dependent carboligase
MALRAYAGKTVLVGFAESFAAVEAIWSLQRAGIDVVAFTRTGAKPAARRIRNLRVTEINAPETSISLAVTDLSRLVRELAPDAILPLDDSSLWLSQRLSERGPVLIGPDAAGARFALDKAAQVAAAASAGIAVPETRVFSAIGDVHIDTWPVILKPADAVLPVGDALVRPRGYIVAGPEELTRAQASMRQGPVLRQALVSGSGEGLFGFAGVHGPQDWSAHRRVRMLNPHGSASSACESIPVDPMLRAQVGGLLEELEWRGLFMAEFLRDAAGTAWFMELNGRAWGSLALATRRGYEYPAWAAQSGLGLPQSPAPPVAPPRVRARHLGREIGHLAFVLRGPQTQAASAWPGRRRTVRDLLTVSHDDRLYNWDPKQPAVLISDTWRSLAGLIARPGRASS